MLKTWSEDLCGNYAKVSYCETGVKIMPRGKFKGEVWDSSHCFAKILHCNREWCPVCGLPWSDSHKQRFARWLPKLQCLDQAGYLVITVPEEKRGDLRDLSALRSIRRSIIRSLKRRGYDRGLSRWHWFGDKYPGKWYPHLNIILDRGALTPVELAEIKAIAAKALGVTMAVCYYHYTSSPRKIVHWGKYITRSTFTDWTWDPEMADELYRFNNCQSWGDWGDLPVKWSLPETDRLLHLSQLESGICPICGNKLTWFDKPDETKKLLLIGFTTYAPGWLYRDHDPPKGAAL